MSVRKEKQESKKQWNRINQWPVGIKDNRYYIQHDPHLLLLMSAPLLTLDIATHIAQLNPPVQSSNN